LFEKEKQSAIDFLRDHWDNLMEYHLVSGLPRTNNFAESVNKQLERRFKTMESFQRKEMATWYINLLVSYLRQKPYTDCRGSSKASQW
jgi:transposase-like protein